MLVSSASVSSLGRVSLTSELRCASMSAIAWGGTIGRIWATRRSIVSASGRKAISEVMKNRNGKSENRK
jgi:hypothetical protein